MTYTTVQGDTWDTAAKYVYGDETKAQLLMEHNRQYLDMMVFPAGVALSCPDMSSDAGLIRSYPEWRN